MPSEPYVWDPWKPASTEPHRIALATDDGDRATCAELTEHAERIGGTISRVAARRPAAKRNRPGVGGRRDA